ncbi:acetylornithine deacetylase [Legionella waltersii]|uniref:Acetylornithine deacetylase n=1 Tax=Legionella waltersii TaxID=66969 RepID=A0A0W1ABR7_9GAMM|nr:acetylornithine deacetylase [Legionella waltersii]KTD78794.1 acetylornithine deacetylase [Legionella waltersii]SNV11110.1 acetylornithine deacetylase [Legionella waltersii]
MTTLDWLKKLIAFDTTSRYSNLDLINYLANALEEHAIKPILIHDSKEPKANLLASIPGKDGGVEGGIVLSGHTDVVPVDGQDWASNPFEATLRGGVVYGRGTCDMKGFIAVVMALLPQIKTMNLEYPVHFAFSYDEEIGCLGAPSLIDKIIELNYHPKACIVGEPTSMKPVIGHKGKQSYRCQIHGVAAHSSLVNQGCNAIEHAASFITYLRDMAKHYQLYGEKDSSYDVPYTTITTNLIKGGNAYNTIPSLCEFIFEFRNLATDDSDLIHQKITSFVDDHLLPEMQAEQSEVEVILDTIAKAPGLETELSEPLVQAAQSLCQSDEVLKVAYATEAGLFQQAQIPTIVCGPGSIEQAHRADEFVSLDQLARCERFIVDMLMHPLVVVG